MFSVLSEVFWWCFVGYSEGAWWVFCFFLVGYWWVGRLGLSSVQHTRQPSERRNMPKGHALELSFLSFFTGYLKKPSVVCG